MTACLAAHRAAPALTLAASASRTASAGAGGTPRIPHRTFISRRVLEILRPTALGDAAIRSFRFQKPASCHENCFQMTLAVNQRLVTRGLMARRQPQQAPTLVRMPQEPATASAPPLDVGTVRRVQDLHGPVQLETRHTLRHGQGGELYENFHATVVLATFERESRTVALLLDGNDHQVNPAVLAFAHWALRTVGMRWPSQFGPADFQDYNAQRRLAPAADAEPDLHQAAFRLVDLGEMLAVSQRNPHEKQSLAMPDGSVVQIPYRPTGLYADPGVSVQQPLLAPETEEALRTALREEPGAVERFP